MKITFLGTGTSQGVPVIGCECDVCQSIDFRDKRLRTSIHIEVDGKSFVVDTGPDFRQQMLRERIHVLDAVIFTHEHKDHVAGLDDVRSFNFRLKRHMPIYATRRVIDQLEKEFHYAFGEITYPGAPRFDVNEIDNSPFEIKGVEFIPIEVLHYKLPVLGYRIKDFTYITDANSISDEELEKVKGTRVLVLDALQREKHISHFTLDEAVDLIQRINPEQAYLIHISHRMGTHRKVEKELPDNISIAYDGLKIIL
ncbi:MBL fold metallo-hydrolase [Marinigracilibium pacificum]|uniref:MBL fold metallo-hydrolase n=1 Tax=Marinigracilibium pacificum TaxID=2729599 RepID=A0A848IX86_9BACT|nr:MBL fold metallo-hydrolase [Marinigracilibium pacificum]NMM49143.1 MBL fold metallo-hydrolase [Marinigracilibium pacificum]